MVPVMAKITASHPTHSRPNPHRFGQPRPSSVAPQAQASPLYPGSPFQPLPAPTGPAPYRLDLAELIPDAVAAMHAAGGMTLHMVGDTGGIQDPNPQLMVAAGLEADAATAGPLGLPAFFYHLGDWIYFDGQAEQYVPQFYEPYTHYDVPMLGVPGNHDGDVFDDGTRTNPLPSLATFVRNQCAGQPGTHSPDAGESVRTAMIQPNVYFTLNTPFATIIGLYTNVPEGGVVEPDQEAWFVGELVHASRQLPVIVALHHPPYSLDVYHSGSAPMGALLARATAKAKRRPHLVCSGHVHNYQRFTVADPTGKGVTPYVVAGMGGYHNLHRMAAPGGQPIMTPYRAPGAPGVTLESCQDSQFGFLRLEISPDTITLASYGVGAPPRPAVVRPVLLDRMTYDWKTRRMA